MATVGVSVVTFIHAWGVVLGTVAGMVGMISESNRHGSPPTRQSVIPSVCRSER